MAQVEDGIKKQLVAAGQLSTLASQQPYYKYVLRWNGISGTEANGVCHRYNYKWTRTIQDSISTVILCAWLGGMGSETKPGEVGRLLTLEDIGEIYHGEFFWPDG